MFERLGWELFLEPSLGFGILVLGGKGGPTSASCGANYQRDFFLRYIRGHGSILQFFLYVDNYYIITRSTSLFLNQPEPSQVWGREQRCVGEILGGYQICFV